MSFESEICARFPALKIERDYSLSRHTTIGCGGRAKLCLYPKSKEEAGKVFSFLEGEKIPFFVLGAGANVLPPEGDYCGVIVKLSALNSLKKEGDKIVAGAGVSGGALLRFARENALSGLEPFCGIPMTVGGGCAMNAGVSALYFSEVVEEVEAFWKGEEVHFDNPSCHFGKKESIFQEGIYITEVVFQLKEGEERNILSREEFFRKKRSSLPKGRSMGCVFKNPFVMPAGMLIERCGLKGKKIGGAFVSEQHANFIINEGGTAGDVSSLIAIVKEEVKRCTGISLKEEIRRIQNT